MVWKRSGYDMVSQFISVQLQGQRGALNGKRPVVSTLSLARAGVRHLVSVDCRMPNYESLVAAASLLQVAQEQRGQG